ncbi:MAG: ATP-binding cassette domain-containing protein, partial [Acidobacteriota bacterium]
DGVYTPTGGAIFLNGERIDGLAPYQIARRGIGRTFQVTRAFRRMTVLENMLVPALAIDPAANRGELEDKAYDILKFLTIEHLIGEYGRGLSGGQQKLLELAMALMNETTVLLLDEPTSYLDYRHQVQVLDLLDHLHRDLDFTLIVVTHDLNATVGCSDSVLALKNGRVAFAGSPERLLNADRLAAIYENDFELIERCAGGVPLVIPSRGVGS